MLDKPDFYLEEWFSAEAERVARYWKKRLYPLVSFACAALIWHWHHSRKDLP